MAEEAEEEGFTELAAKFRGVAQVRGRSRKSRHQKLLGSLTVKEKLSRRSSSRLEMQTTADTLLRRLRLRKIMGRASRAYFERKAKNY